MNSFFQAEKRSYQIDNIAYHCYQAHMPDRLDALICKKWLNIRSGGIEDYSGFLRDIDLSWRLTIADASPNILKLVRYSMINSTINTIAKGIPPALYPVFINNNIWSFHGAMTLADQFVDPWARNEAFLRICFQSNISANELERAFNKALDVKSLKFDSTDSVKASFLSIAAKHLSSNEAVINRAISCAQSMENLYCRQATLAAVAETSRIRQSEILGYSLDILQKLVGIERLHGIANLSFTLSPKDFSSLFDNLSSFDQDYYSTQRKIDWKMSSLFDRAEIAILKKIIPYLPIELYSDAIELISRIVEKDEHKIELYLLMADPYKALYSSRSLFVSPFQEERIEKMVPPSETERLLESALVVCQKTKENDPINYFSNIIAISGLKKELQSVVIKEWPNNIQSSMQIMNSRFFSNLEPQYFEDIVDLIIQYTKALRPSVSFLLMRLPQHLVIKLTQNISSLGNKLESLGILIPHLPLYLQYSWASLAYELCKMPENKELRDRTVYIFSDDNIDHTDVAQFSDMENRITSNHKRLFFDKITNFIKYNDNADNQLHALFTFEQKLGFLNKCQINQIWALYKNKLESGKKSSSELSYLISIFAKYFSTKNQKLVKEFIFDRLIKINKNAYPTANENISILCAFSDIIFSQSMSITELTNDLLWKLENRKIADSIKLINSVFQRLREKDQPANLNSQMVKADDLIFSVDIDDFYRAWVVLSLVPYITYTERMLPCIERAIANPSWGELKESYAAIRAFKYLPVDVSLELLPSLRNVHVKTPVRFICESNLYARLFSSEKLDKKSFQILFDYLSNLDREIWFQNILAMESSLRRYKSREIVNGVASSVLDIHSWWHQKNI